MSFTFVHAADLHLDSQLRGLERYEGAPVELLRSATRRAFEKLVAYCREEKVAFLLLAGDLFDGDWRDYNTGLFFARQMALLRDADIPVLIVRGNHDAASVLTSSLALPENVHVFSSRKAEPHPLEKWNVVVHGQSFAKRAIPEDLSEGYPKREEGAFNIGLLHTSATGREGHDEYAPCKPEHLTNKGYDYWALGHIHKREELRIDPYIIFPGNLQGRHARETGVKGATVVTVNDGAVSSATHVPFDVVRWTQCDVSLENAVSADDAVALAGEALLRARREAGGRSVAARIRLVGSTASHGELQADPERWTNEIRARANEFDDVWVEKIQFSTGLKADFEALRQHDDPIGQLLKLIQVARTDETVLRSYLEPLEGVRAKLPAELRDGQDPVRFDDDSLRGMLDDVEQLLASRLLDAGGAR